MFNLTMLSLVRTNLQWRFYKANFLHVHRKYPNLDEAEFSFLSPRNWNKHTYKSTIFVANIATLKFIPTFDDFQMVSISILFWKSTKSGQWTGKKCHLIFAQISGGSSRSWRSCNDHIGEFGDPRGSYSLLLCESFPATHRHIWAIQTRNFWRHK